MGNTDKGWIKIHRCLLDDEIWLSSEPFSKRDAWIDLLLTAAYKKEKKLVAGKEIDILPGQIVTSFMALSKRWRWSRDKVRLFLRQCGHIQIDRVGRQTDPCILTIEKWDIYQSWRKPSRHSQTTAEPTPRNNKEETEAGMEQLDAVPAEENDEMTMEEYIATWEYTNSTDKTHIVSSKNKD